MLEDIIPIQDELNKRRSQIMDILNTFKGPGVLRETGALAEGEEVVLSPGFDIEVTPGKRFEIQQMPSIPGDLWNSAQQAEQDIDIISGVGEAPEVKAGTPGVALEEVYESQLLQIRQMERQNNGSFRELGQQMWSIMQQLYQDSGYVIRVVGDQGMRIPQIFAPDDIRGEFDFEWIPNSAYSLRRQIWYKQLVELKNLGCPLPWDAILEATDLPDKEGIKKIVKEQEEILAQQQAMMPPEGAPAPMPGG
jgi:hypothetical protein